MGKVKKIEDRTRWFIDEYDRLSKEGRLPSNVELAKILGIRSKSAITNILKGDQNIQPEHWEKFKAHFGLSNTLNNSKISERQPSPMELLAGLTEGFKAIASTMRSIENKMARETTQAEILKIVIDQQNSFARSDKNQLGLASLVGELLMRDFVREAKSNPGNVQKILQDFLRRIGPKLTPDVKESIGVDGHK